MNTAIITGASSGLGAEFLRAVAEKHPELDEIWLIARRRERMEQLISELPYQHFRIIPLDLGSDEAYQELESILHSEKPDIRVLINNAGYEKSGIFAEMEKTDIQKMLSVNVKGLTMVQRVCAPYMHSGSYAVLTCSVSSFTPVPHQAVYSATKKYVYFFGKALRDELRKQGINVLLLCPGNMDTEMNPKGQGRQSKQINRLPFLDLKKLTRKSLALAESGKAVYTPGAFYKGYRFVSKVFPSAFMLHFVRKFY